MKFFRINNFNQDRNFRFFFQRHSLTWYQEKQICRLKRCSNKEYRQIKTINDHKHIPKKGNINLHILSHSQLHKYFHSSFVAYHNQIIYHKYKNTNPRSLFPFNSGLFNHQQNDYNDISFYLSFNALQHSIFFLNNKINNN